MYKEERFNNSAKEKAEQGEQRDKNRVQLSICRFIISDFHIEKNIHKIYSCIITSGYTILNYSSSLLAAFVCVCDLCDHITLEILPKA